MTGVLDDILTEVSHAADLLEKNLDDHVFDTAVHNLVRCPAPLYHLHFSGHCKLSR